LGASSEQVVKEYFFRPAHRRSLNLEYLELFESAITQHIVFLAFLPAMVYSRPFWAETIDKVVDSGLKWSTVESKRFQDTAEWRAARMMSRTPEAGGGKR
jgi:hypothetical protein